MDEVSAAFSSQGRLRPVFETTGKHIVISHVLTQRVMLSQSFCFGLSKTCHQQVLTVDGFSDSTYGCLSGIPLRNMDSFV